MRVSSFVEVNAPSLKIEEEIFIERQIKFMLIFLGARTVTSHCLGLQTVCIVIYHIIDENLVVVNNLMSISVIIFVIKAVLMLSN